MIAGGRPIRPFRPFCTARAAALALLCCLALAGCGSKTVGFGTRYPGAGTPDAKLCRDLTTMPQNLEPYAERAGANTPLLAPTEQDACAEKSRAGLFRPWDLREPTRWLKKALAADFHLKPDKGFIENLRPFPPEEWARLRANARPEQYPLRREYGITVRNTALRAMPTRRPLFLNPDTAGEGYPFDYFQQSALWIGSPVYICHVSADGQWVLAETDASSGWLPAEDVAVADEAFRSRMRASSLAAVVRDRVLVQAPAGSAGSSDRAGRGTDRVTGAPVTVTAHIGTLLPLVRQDAAGLVVAFPRRGVDGRAVWTEARLNRDQAEPWPLQATPANIARLGNQMLGQPYGWGGLLDNRDCSSLTRDLLMPFGIRLPRNSSNQAKVGGRIDLTALSPDDKEARILAEGRPFFSLIRMPGHIGLYLGEYNGKPAMLHSIWGLRVDTAGPDGAMAGRAVIGKTVITSLRPGVELPNLTSPAGLADRVDTLTILSGRE